MGNLEQAMRENMRDEFVNMKLLKAIEEGNTHYFYNSPTWIRRRGQTLLRDNNECQNCKSEGKVTVGLEGEPLQVHHIKHLKNRPDLALTDNNLISLCGSCHNKEHPEKLKIYNEPKKTIDIPERWE